MRIRYTEGKEVPTGEKSPAWWCDPCASVRGFGVSKAPDGEEGTWCSTCRDNGVKSPLRTIMVDVMRYERGTTEVLCCGSWLLCDGFTNTCEECERDYNWAGQQLAPREQWGEETGETAADILLGNSTEVS